MLNHASPEIIATATIGTDHIDIDFCRSRGIEVVNAPGCNAPAVAQWVFATIFTLLGRRRPDSLTLGVVGVGNVGKIVELWGRAMGFNVLLNDPPRALAEGNRKFVDIDTIAHNADIVTFHTPLISSGPFSTMHLADKRFIDSLKPGTLLLNAARGGVVDESSLIDRIERGEIVAAIDCWESEPLISQKLCSAVQIATPHIAGYSLEGKQRATATAIQAVARKLDVDVSVPFTVPQVNLNNISANSILSSYNPVADSRRLKADPLSFEHMRDHYTLRHEP